MPPPALPPLFRDRPPTYSCVAGTPTPPPGGAGDRERSKITYRKSQLRMILGNCLCKPLKSNRFLGVSSAGTVLKKKELKRDLLVVFSLHIVPAQS